MEMSSTIQRKGLFSICLFWVLLTIASLPSWGGADTYVCTPSNPNGSWVLTSSENWWAGQQPGIGPYTLTETATQKVTIYLSCGYEGEYPYGTSPFAPLCYPSPQYPNWQVYLRGRYTYEWRCPCNINITSFKAIPQTINPSAGESTSFSWTISDPAVSTTINVAGRTLNSNLWDGKDASGKIVPPGTYTAVLNDACLDSRSVTITVIAPPKSCSLNVSTN